MPVVTLNRSASQPGSTSGPPCSAAAASCDDARGRLLAAAGPVFARLGFDRATVREICRLAGVNVASVRYYFGDKFGLYREVFRVIRQQCQAADAAAVLVGETPRQTLFFEVRHLLARMLARDNSGWEAQLMMREMNRPTEVFVEMVEESFRPHFERLVQTVAELAPPQTPPVVLQQLVLSTVGQCLYYRVGNEVVRQLIPAETLTSDFDLDSLAQHITAVVISAAEGGTVLRHKAALGCLIDEASEPGAGAGGSIGAGDGRWTAGEAHGDG